MLNKIQRCLLNREVSKHVVPYISFVLSAIKARGHVSTQKPGHILRQCQSQASIKEESDDNGINFVTTRYKLQLSLLGILHAKVSARPPVPTTDRNLVRVSIGYPRVSRRNTGH